MKQTSQLDDIAHEIRAASFDLLGHLAFLRFSRSAREFRYRADQPRAPRGTPDGGQWVDDTGSRLDVALAGRLIDQRVGAGDGKLIRMCTYLDFFGRQYSLELDAAEFCPPTLRARPYYGSFS